MKKALGEARPHGMFDDTFEVEHVMYLLREYAKCDASRLSPKELKSVRANSVLPVLQEKLIAALTDIPLSPITNQREAYVNALQAVRGAPDPGDWSESKLDEFRSQLLEIHAIDGDSARHDAEVAKKAREKTGKTLSDKAAIQRTKAAAKKWGELRKLMRGYIARGEEKQMPYKEWAHKHHVSLRTIYDQRDWVKDNP